MSSSQSLPRLIAMLALAAAVALVGLIATGRMPGFAKNDADARALLERALSGGGTNNPKSGRFNASFAMAVSGGGAQLPALTMQATGAFSGGATANQRKFALDASMGFGGRTVNYGMVSTGKQAFFRVGSSYYGIPPSQLRQAYDERSMNSGQTLAALGLDPSRWLESVRDEGTVDVGGEPTTHVSADVAFSKVFDDMVALADKARPGAVPPELDQADEFKDAVENARVDAYIARGDGSIRKVTLHADIDVDGGSGDIDAALTISDIDKPQRISAPASTKPFSQLQSDLGAGGLGAAAGSAPPAGPESTPPPAVDAAAKTKAPKGDDGSYLSCVRRATTAAALQACSDRLP